MFQKDNLISIIAISKDDPQGLLVTLKSIKQQACFYEVIVIAKGSSLDLDFNSLDIPYIKIFPQNSTGGISSAFNQGIMESSGSWINFLNGGDSYSESNVLLNVASQIRLLDKDVNVITFKSIDAVSGITIPRARDFEKRRIELISHQASFFRRELFSLLGLYSPVIKIRMDFEWMLRAKNHLHVCWIDSVIVNFEGNGISSNMVFQSCSEELFILIQFRSQFSKILILLLGYFPFRVVRKFFRSIKS